jgi:DNA-binding transcriptional MerR regulator
MKIGRKLTLVFAVAALALGVGGGTALAKGPKGARGGPVQSAAKYLGVTVEQLREQLKAGNSLAQAATSAGKTVKGLEDAIFADAKANLDQAVTDGKLTAEKEAQILQRLRDKVDEIVNRTGPPARAKAGKPGKQKGAAALRSAVQATATYLGLTVDQIREQLKAGKSLAQVAVASGKTVAGLEAAIVADAKTVIDKLVADGKISAERGQKYLERIQAHVADLVNKTR